MIIRNKERQNASELGKVAPRDGISTTVALPPPGYQENNPNTDMGPYQQTERTPV